MQSAIDALDRGLNRAAQRMQIKRRVGTSDEFRMVALIGVVRLKQIKDLSGSVTQDALKVIVSPTPFNSSRYWPGDAGGPKFPRKGDLCVINDRPRDVLGVDLITIGETVVRIELTVEG